MVHTKVTNGENTIGELLQRIDRNMYYLKNWYGPKNLFLDKRLFRFN
ncbi:hypothetical protein PPHE_a1744 [Pseudoalteromonas phenolica O-BC30]|nr:hypothetical protein [Pseudoalteromonas phenolica O-BC30]